MREIVKRVSRIVFHATAGILLVVKCALSNNTKTDGNILILINHRESAWQSRKPI